jgi:replicative DNA helicase
VSYWWSDLVDDPPGRDEIDAAASQLFAEIDAWNAEAEADRRRPEAHVSARTAVERYFADAIADHPPAVHTPWTDLDAALGRAIRRSELVLIASRPGVGKTWALLELIAATLRRDANAGAVIYELEMLAEHLGERLAGHALRLSPRELAQSAKRGTVTVEEVMAKAPALGRFEIHEQGLSVRDLPKAIASVEAARGWRPTIIAVDYVGLLEWDGAAGAKSYERVSDNARRLKDVARSEGVAILAAVQLSRAAGVGASKPSLDQMRDSGVLEEAADRVLGLWRDTEIEDETPAEKRRGDVGLVVLKNRFGQSDGEVGLRFDDALRLVERGNEVQDEFPF